MGSAVQSGIAPALNFSGNGGDATEDSYNPSDTVSDSGQVGVASGAGYQADTLAAVNSTINYSSISESPEAIAALESTANTALETQAASTATESTNDASLASKALDAALQGLQSPLQQAAKGIVMPLVVGIVVIAAVYFWRRKS